MLRWKTDKFWFASALLLLACGDDADVEPSGEVDSGAATPLDGSVVREGGRPAPEQDRDGPDAEGPVEDGSAVDVVTDAARPEPQLDAGASAACTVSAASARCLTRSIVKLGTASDPRRVYWSLPAQAAPAAGYPAVLLYQGTAVGPALTWDTEIARGASFGGYYQVALVAELLARGYAVIQPEASGGGYWSTNVGASYDTSVDGAFIPLLLAALEDGTFGELDERRFYATGISSGGYMTSRMAVSYAGRFRALAIESGAYATCLGPFCNIPAQLPADHPPTLLLHGALDTTVPVSTARDYEARLKENGIEVKLLEDSKAGHQWLSTAPQEVRAWFDAH